MRRAILNEFVIEKNRYYYKTENTNLYKEVNIEARRIANHLKLNNRIEYLLLSQLFTTFKDNNTNFNRNPTFRLINPVKTEIGIISKIILDFILNELSIELNLQIWGNSKSVIDCF